MPAKKKKSGRTKILSPFPTLQELAKIMGAPRERVAFLKGLIEGKFLKTGLRSKKEKKEYIKGVIAAFFDKQPKQKLPKKV
ncbi:MAG: hypothetical protein A2835_01200 [Candidatus Niyogibacteria bacterium RIFCSPHIGHO2_01_FULL_45_28]|uniref:Uncharacterized protein n=1 Tax=Candidatus Niyogibacteria bacterium RIFCSPLOWO2_02_FULL_45_13 TaxID=1801725 RepID=A0A1G2EZ91_9BACT|nr:MAG: hypothetical protein A2835_01200 [Candidatus Niyogibacteria bacterium RIFCSPHIGHO2_01_FULL_45_28]OGZ31144.1 MAG: hypothetical protein A3J00_01150 [Candidatus Niyogibacteria bacterium RIFCSPLOWO2_02_FULL_45_13]